MSPSNPYVSVDESQGVEVGKIPIPSDADQHTVNMLKQKFLCCECRKTTHESALQPGYKTLCRFCYENKETGAIVKAKADKVKQLISSHIVSKGAADLHVPHICEMGEEMIKLFGGLSQFCAAWKAQIDAAAIKQPGGRNALQGFREVMRLIQISTEARDTAPDMASISDEDMMRELETLFKGSGLVVDATAHLVHDEVTDESIEEIAEEVTEEEDDEVTQVAEEDDLGLDVDYWFAS